MRVFSVGTILIYGQCPDLPGTPLATDDAPWRPHIQSYERAHAYLHDSIRAWLDGAGHAGVACRVIPIHRLAARLYDDALAGTIPGGITTHRAFRVGYDETGATETHQYLWHERGVWAMQALFRLVAFGDLPSTLPTDSHVDASMASYLAGIVQDIVSNYALAGHGGMDQGEAGVVPYSGETPAEIMPDATVHLIDFANAALYSDRAGTIPALDGGPVGRIVAGDIVLTAQSDTARPVLTGEMVYFTADPMTGALPASIRAEYIAAVLPMIAAASANVSLMLGGIALSRRGSAQNIGIDAPNGWNPYVGINDWRDGRKVLFEVIRTDPQLQIRAVALEGVPSGARVRTATDTGTTYPVAGTSIQLSSTQYGQPHQSSPLLFLVASRPPTDIERAKLYAWMNARTGLVAW